MKLVEINKLMTVLLIGMLTGITVSVSAQTLAFPGAEGYGKYTTGGRGGEVIYVTNLNDSGPGSLRSAVEKKGPRIIVFSTSGNIHLKSPVIIGSGDLTIAGQSAPGQGITIRDYPVELDADNIIIRYMRFRLGDIHKVQGDALSGLGTENVIVDHCSMSWGIDEVSSFYRNNNFTLQWSIISESLKNSFHEKGAHGYGGIWGGNRATFHHNLIAHHSSRNPRLADSDPYDSPTNRKLDYYNNVIYNWEFNSMYGGEKGEQNIVNNYYKAGPGTDDDVSNRIVNPSEPYGKFYVKGNFVYNHPGVSEKNWNGGVQTRYPEQTKAQSSFGFNPKNLETAEQAFSSVLEHVGASFYRDEIDSRIIEETRKGTATFKGSKSGLPGIIDSQKDVGGWPELKAKEAPLDTDLDGMPDSWEVENNLNPDDPSDSNLYTLHKGYTNVEMYLNGLVE
ncbi:pectate lyase [Gracilimonas sp.]|uniref:pectate lyase family protein n=1 Tax=Gracilimonas sp. TaxID=1974203 RepID=UPI0032EB1C1B